MSVRDVQSVERGPRQVARRMIIDAPAEQLFQMLADPHRHHEVDGSGTVQAKVTGPHRLAVGDRFCVAMSFKAVPYKITSTTTDVVAGELIEWEHPLKHRWRWEFRAIDDAHTEVTEIWDYRANNAARLLELMHYPQRNAAGIEATLSKLAKRYGPR